MITNIEQQYVMDAYSAIASSFNCHRSNPWKATVNFLKSLPANATVLDAGCGNGRNMLVRRDLNMVGFDACEKLIEICKSKSLNVFVGNIKQIPLENDMFDAIICIAVIGHIYSEADRICAVNELMRVLKKDGVLFLQCWNTSAKSTSNRGSKFTAMPTSDDYIVTYGIENTERYYHLFDEHTLEKLLIQCDCKINKIYDDPAGVIAILGKN